MKKEQPGDESSSSSDGEDEEWGRRGKSKKKKSSSSKKLRAEVKKEDEREEGEVDDDDDEEDDADDEFNDGFDENLFGDEEDQKRLSQMTEKEREQELFNRSEKREVLRTRFEIERKLRHQKRAEKERLNRKAFSESSLRSNERRRDLEAKNVRRDALKGLKEQREKKKLKQQKLRASDVYSSSSESDDEDGGRKSSSSSTSSSSEDSDNDAAGRRRRVRDDERHDSDDDVKDNYIVTLEDLNTIKISRSMIEKWIHAPFFSSTLTDAYTKVGIGSKMGQSIYRICQIVEVTEGTAVYDMANTKTNKLLRLRYGKDERNFKLEYVSNGIFAANEFTAWKDKLEKDNMDLPDRKLVESKRRDINVAENYRFTDQDIESMLKEKEKFNKTPKNFAMKKTQLLKQKEQAEQMGDDDEVARLQKELDELEEKAKELDKARTHSIAAISYINERNRARNIAEAEKAITQDTKDRENNACDDPFRRRMCAPQLVAFKSGKKGIVKTEPGLVVKAEPVSPIKEQVTPRPAVPAAVKLERPASPEVDPSDLFSAHNFDIQIDFDLGPGLPPSHPAAAGLMSSANGTDTDSKKFIPNRRSINLEEYKKKMHLI